MGVPTLLLFNRYQKRRVSAPTYSDKILSLGPIAYWPLNDTSGSAAVNLVSTALNGAYTGVTLGQTQAPFVAPLFDGSTSFVNIYSAGLNTAWDRDEYTLSLWAKVSGAGMWTDGVARHLFLLLTNPTTNNVTVRRSTSNGTLVIGCSVGGTNESVAPASLSYTGWFHIAITVSKVADEMKAYLNGAQTGTTQTGIGIADANNLLNTSCVIGAQNTTPGSVFSGWLAHCAIFNSALSAANIANLYNWGAG